RIRGLEDPQVKAEADQRIDELNLAIRRIREANRAGFLDDDTVETLRRSAQIVCLTAEGEEVQLLAPKELEAITVRRGTLTDAERHQMELHVTYTAQMLHKMQFHGDYESVPAWASAHHEQLDGSGYPDHLRAESLPDEVRILTILDIYDALTAEDRPYKPPMPVEKAFAVLRDMAEHGKLDGELLDYFVESGAWKKD
ncbi:MAG: HD domain-containing protein, partial [Lachnospiraceae bacterium]|nr:HD domain-containing protein [Lachnospiraceae bacterium]